MHIGAISWATAQLTVATTAADIVDNRFLVGFTLCVCDFSQIECRLLFFCRFNDSAVQFFTLATSIFIVQPSLIYCSFSPHSLTTIKSLLNFETCTNSFILDIFAHRKKRSKLCSTVHNNYQC